MEIKPGFMEESINPYTIRVTENNSNSWDVIPFKQKHYTKLYGT